MTRDAPTLSIVVTRNIEMIIWSPYYHFSGFDEPLVEVFILYCLFHEYIMGCFFTLRISFQEFIRNVAANMLVTNRKEIDLYQTQTCKKV